MSVINLNEEKVKIKFVGKNTVLEYLFFQSYFENLVQTPPKQIPLV